jgi:SAM-dependent methyltransferase
LPLVFLFRVPIELWLYVATLVGRRDSAPPASADYDQLIANGTEKFYEPRRTTCPMCNAPDLVVNLRNADLLQRKPGEFTLERCRACDHVFQNPRLSLAGLDYYYKDFYDGIGEQGMEFIFGFGAQPYHARAKMVRELAQPARWLDVGAGHGHFCIAAREDLPDTRFDGLDLSESIDEAKRRGWIDTAYRGLFPELATQLAGRYDAISMSHYLEHTLDPRAELAAAHTALAPAGCLLIEVPDPEFFLGRVLGRYWLPWFQPQHINFVSVQNLERLLREHGFTPLAWHRGAAHQRVDFFFAAWLLLNRLAPSPSLPWRKRGAVAAAWHRLVWTLGSTLIVTGVVVDNLIGPLFTRARVSNTYRVVARKEAPV